MPLRQVTAIFQGARGGYLLISLDGKLPIQEAIQQRKNMGGVEVDDWRLA
jgi:hypothetical protein